ncbi:hypothetical protein CCR75_005470 [Bremia lactucae]|uniref:Peptidase S1 domain-containing protein n=1 Tax=Bremia lactucae TaxID=4779 RepID=A0A976IDD9_BRELC|nr:hypothetical protein CCR75_005470 [Bremia lactucae]
MRSKLEVSQIHSKKFDSKQLGFSSKVLLAFLHNSLSHFAIFYRPPTSTYSPVMKIFTPIVAASMAVAGVASDVASPSRQLIVGGRNALPGEHDFVVSVRAVVDEITYCQGCLISPNIVVTTQFCGMTEPAEYKLDYAVVGAYNSLGSTNDGKPDGEAFKIIEHIIHPKFSDPIRSVNLAVLVLDGESKATPMSLPQSSEINLETPLRGFGYGTIYHHDDPDNARQSETLQTSLLNPISHEDCVKKNKDENITTAFFCATGENNGGFCFGDSGGTVIDEKNRVAVGIYSHGTGCNNNIISNLAPEVEWLKGIIKQYAPKYSSAK